MIAKIEYPYGNVVTNIPRALLEQTGVKVENQSHIQVSIIHRESVIYEQRLPYTYSFGYVKKGEPMVYPDSVQRIGLAVNGYSFAKKYGIEAGKQWKIKFTYS